MAGQSVPAGALEGVLRHWKEMEDMSGRLSDTRLRELRKEALDMLVEPGGVFGGEADEVEEILTAFVSVVPELLRERGVREELLGVAEEFGRASDGLGEIGVGLSKARAGVYGRVAGVLKSILAREV